MLASGVDKIGRMYEAVSRNIEMNARMFLSTTNNILFLKFHVFPVILLRPFLLPHS